MDYISEGVLTKSIQRIWKKDVEFCVTGTGLTENIRQLALFQWQKLSNLEGNIRNIHGPVYNQAVCSLPFTY